MSAFSSTCDVLFEGRNKSLLIKRLKKRGVGIISMKKIDDKRFIIRVKCSDLSKVFEISENMWYNTIVRYHGLKKLLLFFKKNLALVISAILFIVTCVTLDGIILTVDLENVDKPYRAAVERVLKSEGIGRFTPFFEVDFSDLENKLLSVDGVESATVGKKGYALYVRLKGRTDGVIRRENASSLVSADLGEVVSVTVYKGRALVAAGDKVNVGDLLMDGKIVLSDGREIDGQCEGRIVLRKTITEEFTVREITDGEVSQAVAKARLNVFGEDEKAVSSVTPTGAGYIISVTLFFNVVYGD